MYVVVKNGKTILGHGINKDTWKYLDECKEFAVDALEDQEDTIEVCELKPLYTYNLELMCKETPAQEEEEKPADPAPVEPSEPGAEETPNETE